MYLNCVFKLFNLNPFYPNSDQTDPFNRQPLSLDMVIPQTELKTKIEEWRAGRMKNL